jgi:acyl-CoA thioester hydrolase
MEEHRSLLYTAHIPIRWGDMDAYGHVNNTNYFRYMEQARVEYLEQAGFPIRPHNLAPVIVNTACTFLLPLTYPGTLELKMFAGSPGRSSIPTFYEFRLQEGTTLYATGEARIVWIDMSTGKAVAIPETLRATLPAAG